MREAGDVVLAVEAGAIRADDLVPLGDLVRGVAALEPGFPRVFKSTGLAWEDAVLAAPPPGGGVGPSVLLLWLLATKVRTVAHGRGAPTHQPSAPPRTRRARALPTAFAALTLPAVRLGRLAHDRARGPSPAASGRHPPV